MDASAGAVLSPDTPVSASLSPTQTVLYRIEGTAGHKLILDSLLEGAAIDVSLFGPDGSRLYTSESDTFEDFSQTLFVSGTYTLVLNNSGDSASNLSFQLQDLALPSLTPSGFGTFSGSVGTSGTEFELQANGGTLLYFNTLSYNSAIRLELVGPTGDTVFSNLQTTHSRDNAFELLETGIYRLRVWTRSGNHPYNFQLLALEESQPLELNAAQSIVLAGAASQVFKVSGVAGQQLMFNGLDQPDPRGRIVYARARLFAADGSEIRLSNSDVRGSTEPITLTQSGDYYWVFTNQGSSEQTLNFQVLDRGSAVTIEKDTPLSASFGSNGRESAWYRFLGEQGERIYLNTDHGRSGVSYQVFNDAGQVIAENSNFHDSVFELSHSGEYWIAVSSTGTQSNSSYTLHLVTPEPQTSEIELDQVITGELSELGQFNEYRFEVAAGQRVLLDYLSNTSLTWELTSPDGSTVLSDTTYRFDHRRRINHDRDRLIRLTEAGTYTLRLSGTPNPYSFQLLSYDSLTTTASETIAVDTPISGQFEHSTYQTQLYRFRGEAGQPIYIDFTGSGTSHLWSLHDAEGERLALNSPVATSAGSERGLSQDFDSIILPYSGEYELRINGEGGNQDSYQFQIFTSEWTEQAYSLGDVVSGEIGRPGDRNIYTFSGTAGETLYFDSLFDSPRQLDWSIISPSGRHHLVSGRDASRDGRFTLTETGSYELLLDGSGNATGSYEFRLFNYDSAPEAIALDTPVNGEFGPSNRETRLYRFTGEAGQRIYIDASIRSSFYGDWVLYSDSLKLIAGSRDMFSGDFELVLPESGNYILQLSGRGRANTNFSFEVTTPELITQDYTLGEVVSSGISERGEQAVYSFEGVAGQRLFLDSQFPSERGIRSRLIAPSGRQISSTRNTSLTQLEGVYVLQESGTYRLEIDGDGAIRDEYRFRLVDMAAEVARPELAISSGEIVSGDIGGGGNNSDFYTISGNAGQRLHLAGIGNTNAFKTVRVLSDRFEQLLSYQQLSSNIDELVLPYTGTYIVQVSGELSRSFLESGIGTETTYQFRMNISEIETQDIAFGERLSGEIAAAGDQQVYTFSGSEGQSIIIDAITGNSNLVGRLYDPDGSLVRLAYRYPFGTVTPIYEFGTDRDTTPIRLQKSGTYRLEIDGLNTASGSFNLQVNELSQLPELPLGSTVLAAPTDNATVFYQFSGRAGQSFSFTFDSSLSFESSHASREWAVYSANGTRINGAQLTTSNRNFSVGLPSDGTYVLAIDTGAIEQDTYQFSVSETTAIEPITPSFSDEPITLFSGESHRFSAEAGTLLYIDRISGGSSRLRGELRAPDGSKVRDINSASNPGLTRLTQSGDYTLSMNGSNASLHWQFRLLELPRQLSASETTVEVGSFVEEQTGSGNAASLYSFEGRQGQRLLFNGTQGQVGAQIYDAEGVRIGRVNRLDTIPAQDQFTLERDGVYSIVVEGQGQASFGFQLLDVEQDAFPLPFNRPFSSSLSNAKHTDLLSFEATEGQRLFFDFRDTPIVTGAPTLRLYAPDGELLNNHQFSRDSILELRATQSGRYRIEVGGNGSSTNPFHYGFSLRAFDESVEDVITPGSGESSSNDDGSLGQFQVQIAAEDDRGGVAIQEFSLRIHPDPDNTAPTITSLPPTAVYGLNQRGFEYFIKAIDPDGDALSYRLLEGPPGATLNRDTGHLVFINDSAQVGDSLNFTVEVADAKGGRDTQHFTLEVVETLGTFQGAVFEDINGNAFQDNDLLRFEDVPYVHFVIDLSGSVRRRTFPSGDVDLETVELNTPLDLELAGAIAFSQQLIDSGLGDVANIAVSLFNDGAGSLNLGVDPNTQQLFIHPNTDSNLNDIPDFEERLTTITGRVWAGTNFNAGLSQGIDVLETVNDPDNSTLIFLTDGLSVVSPEVVERVTESGIYTRAFAFGPFADTQELLKVDPNAVEVAGIEELVTLFSGFGRVVREPFMEDVGLYLDLNSNGVLDEEEPLQFTTFERPQSALSRRQLFTFEFENLTPGEYTARVLTPTGFTSTTHTDAAFSFTITEQGETIRTKVGLQQEEAIANGAPEFITTPPTTAVNVGERFLYPALALDPDADAVTYSVISALEGIAIDPESGVLSFTATDAQTGSYDIFITARDSAGNSTLQSFQVEVLSQNQRPLFTSLPEVTQAQVGKDYHYQATAIDPDEDAITFGLVGGPAGVEIDSETGLLTWTPTESQLGNQIVQIQVTDSKGATSLQTIVLEAIAPIPNRLPQLQSSPRTTTDIGSLYLYDILATDPDGDALSYSLEQAPAGARLEGNRLLWVPTVEQSGRHEFVLRVSDSQGGSITQDFSILARNQAGNNAPVIESTPDLFTHLGEDYRYDLQGSDVDGDSLIWTLVDAPQGVVLDPVSGNLRWQPDAGQLGAHTITVQLADARGGTTTQSFELTVRGVNTPPLIISPPQTRAAVGQTYRYQAVATDIDNDPLSYALGVHPQGLEIDGQTGAISFVPTVEQLGEHRVEVQVRDGSGAVTRQAYTLLVTESAINSAPTITSQPIVVTEISQPYRYQVEASDPDVGDPLTFTLLEGPEGVRIDAETGLLEWASPVAGEHRVVVGVRDQGGLGAFQGYVLRALSNQLPQISSIPVTEATPGGEYGYDVHATDPEGGVLLYSLDAQSVALGLSIDQLGRIRWLPTDEQVGNHPVTLTVTDELGGSISQAFEIVVAVDEVAPLVSLMGTNTEVALGDALTLLASATDNIGVELLTLEIDGIPVALNADGTYTFTPDGVGEFRAVATATDAAGNVSQAEYVYRVRDFSDGTPPTVELYAEQFDEFVTAPTDVFGVVNDDNLDFYTLSVARVGSDEFREIYRGDSNTEGDIGDFDPTLLQNDAYTLRLEAFDLTGNSSAVEQTVQVSGGLKLGNFQVSFTDLTIPLTGIPITVTRTYDSLNADESGELGYGWRLEFRDTDLRTSLGRDEVYEELGVRTQAFDERTRVYITLPGQERQAFTFAPTVDPISAYLQPVADALGLEGDVNFYRAAFQGDAGVTSTLEVEGFNSFLSRAEDNTFVVTGNVSGFNPADTAAGFSGVYRLTTKEGIVYRINANTGDLLTVEDLNSNRLTLTESGILSSTGQSISFQRDSAGRIVSITDPAGNQIRYEYDVTGDLVSVTDREDAVTRFAYHDEQAHYLSEIVDPLGRSGIRNEYGEDGRLKQVLDANGESVSLDYDVDNSIATVTDVFGHSSTYIYDERGNTVLEVDRLGTRIEQEFDENNNILSQTTEIQLASGGTQVTNKRFTYDSNNNIISETDSLGHTKLFTYNDQSLVLSITDELGHKLNNSYDSRGNLTSARDQLGNEYEFQYDLIGNLTQLSEVETRESRFSYGSLGLSLTVTDGLGNQTHAILDHNGKTLSERRSVTLADGRIVDVITSSLYDNEGRQLSTTNAENETIQFQYDSNGQLVSRIDALNRETKFRYNLTGQLVETIFPDLTIDDDSDNDRIISVYDRGGRLRASINEASHITYFNYDALDNLTETIRPDGVDTLSDLITVLSPSDTVASIDWTQVIFPDLIPDYLDDNARVLNIYDSDGLLSATIDERGNRTEYRYDERRLLQEVIAPSLTSELDVTHSTQFQYDAAGRLVKETNALGQSTEYILNAIGQPIEVRLADGKTISNLYDGFGRLVGEIDQAGNLTSYEYDLLNRLTAVVKYLEQGSSSPEAIRTEYGYDELGRLIYEEDANGKRTFFEYDLVGRRIAEILPEGERAATTYNAVGNIETYTDFNGDLTTYTYDLRDRLIRQDFSDGTFQSFTYTPTGMRSSATDYRGTTIYEYDDRDRLIARIEPNGLLNENGKSIEYTYDIADNRTQVRTPNESVNYTFDERNRLVSVTDSDDATTTYTYDGVDNLIRTEFSNDIVEVREYDELNRLIFLENTLDENVLSSYQYSGQN